MKGILSCWDKTLTIESRRDTKSGAYSRILPGGVPDQFQPDFFANQLVNSLRNTEAVQYLYLDADRSYPPLRLESHLIVDAMSQPWENPQFRRQHAIHPTKTLYEQWINYILAQEMNYATQFSRKNRIAQMKGEELPTFVDQFADYRTAVQRVLPHLIFVGADTEGRTIRFDSSGEDVAFASLSGGEREIAFLIGQIDRFQLRRGLFLLDEPELHLNADLLRTWVTFLRDSVENGQVWIATHALEAVEVAGPEATFVLERAENRHGATAAFALVERPAFSALATAVGAPAFTLANRHFVYIEGDGQGREQERFYQVCGEPTINRFLEVGSCGEVVERLAGVIELTQNSDEQLRVGGVIDRDFRTPQQIAELRRQAPIYVLECHEIENLFLHPDIISRLLVRAGRPAAKAATVLREASDRFAGMWITQRAAMVHPQAIELKPELRRRAGSLSWKDFAEHAEEVVCELTRIGLPYGQDANDKCRNALTKSVQAYKKDREASDLWKVCLGKQVMDVVAKELGFASRTVYEQHVKHLWDARDVALPPEAQHLKAYVDGLSSTR